MADSGSNKMMKWVAIILLIISVDVIAGVYIGKKLLVPYLYGTEYYAELQEDMSEQTSKDDEENAGPGITKQLEPINLNPADSNGEIFSCDITLEATDQAVIDEISTRDSQIKDIILTYLSYKTVSELNDVSQRKLYRDELMGKINSVLTTGSISNLYITQWILQFN